MSVKTNIKTLNNLSLSHPSQNLWSGILFGLGLVAFIDETAFHQLLH